MTKQIRHVSELPKWFDLAKYAEAELLDLAGWCEQFVVRRDIWLRIYTRCTRTGSLCSPARAIRWSGASQR
jgi:hypothetical protein